MVGRGRRGYTLAEMMIAVAVTGILASLGAGLMTQINRFYLSTKSRSDLQKEARGIMYIMTRELRQAQSMSIVVDRAAATQPYYSRITFTKEQGASVSFFQSGNVLKQQSGVHIEILSKNLRYLAFTFPRTDDLTIMTLSMTLQTSTYNGQTKVLHTASQQVRIMD